MNEAAANLFVAKERNEIVLMKLLHIFCELLMVPVGMCSHRLTWQFTTIETTGTHNLAVEEDDDYCGLFLSGLEYVSVSMLRTVDVTVLLKLFNFLPSRRPARICVLLLLMKRCAIDKAAFQAVGGMPFFRNLLIDRSPGVA